MAPFIISALSRVPGVAVIKLPSDFRPVHGVWSEPGHFEIRIGHLQVIVDKPRRFWKAA